MDLGDKTSYRLGHKKDLGFITGIVHAEILYTEYFFSFFILEIGKDWKTSFNTPLSLSRSTSHRLPNTGRGSDLRRAKRALNSMPRLLNYCI